jgi:surface carbohydrate biosynthesis protein
MNLQRFEIPRLMPDVMVTSGYRKTTYKSYKKFKDMGIAIAVLETEGGFMYNEELLKLRIEDQKGSNNVVDLFFCWGDKYKKIVEKYTDIESSKVFVTGNPRFEIKKHWPEKRDKIVFSPNFSFLHNGILDKAFIERFKTNNNIDVSFNFEGFDKHYLYFLHVAKMVDQKYPGQVIYRPHPFDDMGFLKEQLKGTTIAFDDNFSISETLVNCATCIQNSSTTGFEALLYEIPTIIPREVNSNFRSKEIDEMSYILTSDEAIIDHVEKALQKELPIQQKFLDALNFVCRVDSNSSALIVDILNKHAFENANSPILESDLLPQKKRIKKFLKAISKGNLNFKLLNLSFYDQWKGSFKEFTPKDVNAILIEYRKTDLRVEVTKPKGSEKLMSIHVTK